MRQHQPSPLHALAALRLEAIRPQDTVGDAGLVGGGQPARPGEVSLAHGGVLFLDELPEFRRDVLEALPQPIEAARGWISRARALLRSPSRFPLVAAMHPSPRCLLDAAPPRR